MSVITKEAAAERWRGVVAPLVTPFGDDGDVNLDALRANVEWLFDQGARTGNTVLLAAGSGGDFTSMSVDERAAVIQTTAEVADGRAPVIAGVQSNDVRETIRLCLVAQELGIDGVQIGPPSYYDGRPGDALAWFDTVAAETEVAFVLYNNWYTGYDMPIDLIGRLLELPNSVGVKWSSPSGHRFEVGVRAFRGRAVLMNNSSQICLGHMLGCASFVSHFSNFWPEHPWEIQALMDAHRYHQAQNLLASVMDEYEPLVAQVAALTAGEGVFVRPAMAAVGLDGGHSRLPSRDEAVTDEIRAGFARLVARRGAPSPVEGRV